MLIAQTPKVARHAVCFKCSHISIMHAPRMLAMYSNWCLNARHILAWVQIKWKMFSLVIISVGVRFSGNKWFIGTQSKRRIIYFILVAGQATHQSQSFEIKRFRANRSPLLNQFVRRIENRLMGIFNFSGWLARRCGTQSMGVIRFAGGNVFIWLFVVVVFRRNE